jgi:hypothetical protein
MKTTWTNRRTAAVASAICLVLIVAIALLSAKPSSDTILRRPSTFFTDPSGGRAIYLILQRVLPSTGQWRLPLSELKPASKQGIATLIAMAPATFGQADANALDAWIAAGGQLILASNTDWYVQKNSNDRTTKDFLARHAIPTGRGGAGNAVEAALIRPIGRGRIIYVPNSYAFSNLTLRTTDNAVWLVARCTEWGGHAVFDEYHLGFAEQRGLLALLWMFIRTPWGLFSAQLAAAGAIYIFGCKRRFGRPVEELPIERTNPIETVQALGGLLKTAQARALCARSIHQYLNTHVSSMLGYRVDIVDDPTRERLSGSLRIGGADLESYAQAVRAARSTKPMSDAQFIQFGQKATTIARSFRNGAARSKRSARSIAVG